MLLAASLGLKSTRAQASNGKAIYDAHCVECHGPNGNGDGPAAPVLSPRPRDLTAGRFKIRSTESGHLPTDDDLIRTVRDGLYGTSMAGWSGVLSDTEIRDVVAHLKTLTPRFADENPVVVIPGEEIPRSPESIERGKQVYGTLQCRACHGTDGRGTGAISTDHKDDWNEPLPSADLTQPWTFRGGSTARDVYLRFRTGMSGTPMPSFLGAASNADMWDLANYVVSLARKPVWQMTADEINEQYSRELQEARRDPVKRGKYLVDTHGCVLCHSPLDSNGRIMDGLSMAGGQLIRIKPFGDYPTGNLTSDKDTGLGNWTDDEIKRVITTGILRDGIRLPPFPMDWGAFSALTSDDLNAIVAYLRTIPPVANRVPRPRSTPLPAYFWEKFRLLVLKQDQPIGVFPGNAGSAGSTR